MWIHYWAPNNSPHCDHITVTNAHSYDVLFGATFLHGTDVLIDWRRQQLTIGDTGGSRDVVPLTQVHPVQKTDHLYYVHTSCRSQTSPLLPAPQNCLGLG